MVTASHNPKDYNGFKLCRRKPSPSRETRGSARSVTSSSPGISPETRNTRVQWRRPTSP